MDTPIQVTRVDVGEIKVGKGVEMQPTVISTPMMVASGELADLFPRPLDMPKPDLRSLSTGAGAQSVITMPEPLPMPAVDWAEIVPPLSEAPVSDGKGSGGF
jgi:hypothetical protein